MTIVIPCLKSTARVQARERIERRELYEVYKCPRFYLTKEALWENTEEIYQNSLLRAELKRLAH